MIINVLKNKKSSSTILSREQTQTQDIKASCLKILILKKLTCLIRENKRNPNPHNRMMQESLLSYSLEHNSRNYRYGETNTTKLQSSILEAAAAAVILTAVDLIAVTSLN